MSLARKFWRGKALDRYFALIFLAFVAAVFAGTVLIERKISTSSLQDATRQHIQTARILTKTVERDLDTGEVMSAWKQLNQGSDYKTLMGILMVEDSGKLLVDDPDFESRFTDLRKTHGWKLAVQGERTKAEISSTSDLMVVTERLEHASIRGINRPVNLVYLFNLQDVASVLSLIHWSFRIFFSGLVLVGVVFFLMLRRAFGRSFVLISEGVQQILANQEPKLESKSVMADYFPSVPFLRRFTQEFRETKEKLAKQVKLATLGEVAAQVSHDIGSPLAALDTLLAQTQNSQIPEEPRLQLRSAVGRIRDILADLRTKSSDKKDRQPVPRSLQLLSSILDFLVTEKRLEYRHLMAVQIECVLDRESYGLFADIKPDDFQRMLSNLINNAVEAMSGRGGRVEVRLRGRGEIVQIQVVDNGKGIPPEIIGKLGELGQTFGKEKGTGRGLYHAKTTIESWDGFFGIESSPGKNTTVTISLPKSPAPRWFLEGIDLRPGQWIAVLDDDGSIHTVWKGRFESLRLEQQGVRVFHFSSGTELRRWISELAPSQSVCYLVDYELLGQSDNGLNLIEDTGIRKQSVLVTSRYDEPAIRERCEQLEVKLLPKAMTGFVPIHCVAPHSLRLDGVLIDDQIGNLMAWGSSSQRSNKSVRLFPNFEKFGRVEWMFDRATPIFVDWRLGEGVGGKEVSREIAGLGFREITIVTADEEAKGFHAEMPWVRGFRGKTPPWDEL